MSHFHIHWQRTADRGSVGRRLDKYEYSHVGRIILIITKTLRVIYTRLHSAVPLSHNDKYFIMLKHALSQSTPFLPAPRRLRGVEAGWLINDISLHNSEGNHDVQHPIAESNSHVDRLRISCFAIRNTKHLDLIRRRSDAKARRWMLNGRPQESGPLPSAHRFLCRREYTRPVQTSSRLRHGGFLQFV